MKIEGNEEGVYNLIIPKELDLKPGGTINFSFGFEFGKVDSDGNIFAPGCLEWGYDEGSKEDDIDWVEPVSAGQYVGQKYKDEFKAMCDDDSDELISTYSDYLNQKDMKKSKQWAEKEGLPTDKKSATLKWEDADRMITECSKENLQRLDREVVNLHGSFYAPKDGIDVIIVSHDHEGLRIDVEYDDNRNLMYSDPTSTPSNTIANTMSASLKINGINNIITPDPDLPKSCFKITFIN